MAHVIAGFYSGTLTNTGSPSSVTITGVNVGTGAGRAIQIMFQRRGDRFPTVVSATIGGESMTVQGSDVLIPTDTNVAIRGLSRINPTVTGTQDLVITCTSSDGGNSPIYVLVEVIDGVDTEQSAPVPTTNSDTSDTATVTQSSAEGRQVVVSFIINSASDPNNVVVTGWTLPEENGNPAFGGGLGFATGYAAGATSVTADCEWFDTVEPVSSGWVAMAFDYTAPGGPVVERNSSSITTDISTGKQVVINQQSKVRGFVTVGVN